MLRRTIPQLSHRASGSARRMLSVSAREDGRLVSELAFVLKTGGSRYEPAPGVAHLLSKFAFRNTQKKSALRITRETELLGGQLGVDLGREELVLSARFLRQDLPYFVDLLSSVANSTLYQPFEFTESVLPQAQAEAAVANSSNVALALNNAHTQAFRRGLGNAPYVSSMTKSGVEEVKKFASSVYNASNLSVHARGVVQADLEELLQATWGSQAQTEAPSQGKVELYGGDTRITSAHPQQVAVLAFPGAPSAARAALGYALASHPVKWSPGSGLLDRSVKGDVSVATDYAGYSDASLFSIVLSGGCADQVSTAAKSVVSALKSGLSEEDAQRAAARFKLRRADAALALRAAPELSGDSEVSASELKDAAAALLKGKVVLSVAGNTRKLAYLDELL